VEASIQSNIDAFNAAFAEYVKYTSKTPQKALEHKVMRLGFALWQGFSAHEFGGYPRRPGIARAELAARTIAGLGTKIRGWLMDVYLAERSKLRSETKAIRGRQYMGLQSAKNAGVEKTNREARVRLWQKIVGTEVAFRQRGIGMLGAAFLWYRWRHNSAKGRFLQRNTSGKTLGSVEVGDGVATIEGNVAGLDVVGVRYGIVNKAITDQTADMLNFVKDRQDAAAAQLLRAFA